MWATRHHQVGLEPAEKRQTKNLAEQVCNLTPSKFMTDNELIFETSFGVLQQGLARCRNCGW